MDKKRIIIEDLYGDIIAESETNKDNSYFEIQIKFLDNENETKVFKVRNGDIWTFREL